MQQVYYLLTPQKHIPTNTGASGSSRDHSSGGLQQQRRVFSKAWRLGLRGPRCGLVQFPLKSPPGEQTEAVPPGLPGGPGGKKLPASAGDPGPPRVGETPWRRDWEPTPVLLPGKPHGQSSLEGHSSWARRVGHSSATKPPPRCLPTAHSDSTQGHAVILPTRTLTLLVQSPTL